MGWTAEDEAAVKVRADEIRLANAARENRSRERTRATTVAVVFGAVVLFAMASCHQSRPLPTAPASPAPAPAAEKQKGPVALKSLDGVDGVFVRGKTLTVSMMNADGAGAADDYYLNIASLQAIDVGFSLHDGVTDNLRGVKSVNIILRTVMMDRLGNPVPAPLLMATYSLADIRAANIGALGPAGFLNLARAVTVGPGVATRLVAAWCAKNPDAAYFCARALRL